MYIVLHVKYQLLLSYFNETRISWKNFREIFKFHENLSSGKNLSMRTDRHDEAYSLLFARAILRAPLKKRCKGQKVSAHATKAYRWSRYKAPLILNLDAKWRNVVNFRFRPFQTWEVTSTTNERTGGELGRPQRRCVGILEERNIFCSYRDSNHGSSSR